MHLSLLRLFKKRISTNKQVILQTLCVALLFCACAAFYYLGSATTSCTVKLATGPGDQTAGPIWLNSIVNKPLWGNTSVSNAPYGESLRSPVMITGALQYFIFWVSSLLVGPVCGFNLYTALALVSSAMAVYLFVRSLTRRVDVSVFAGFAATFTPYIQSKIGVHPSYSFFGVFVLTIWSLLSLWRAPTTKKALILGIVISSFFYIDPYFILLGGVVVGTTLAAFLIRLIFKAVVMRDQPTQLKKLLNDSRILITKLLISGGVVVVLALVPLVLVRVKYGAQINAEVSSARSPIKQEAVTYGARVSEYIWPAPQNPYLSRVMNHIPASLQRKPHGSNAAENTLSISIVVGVTALITVVIWFVSITRKWKKQFNRNQQLAVGVLLLIAVAAFLTSLPPGYRGILLPVDIITDYISVWRVFARLQVVVAFSLAIIASIGLSYLTKNMKKVTRICLVLLLIVIVGFEYLTFSPLNDRRAWSYAQVHPFYYWLKSQTDVDTVAEYPLNEPGQTNVIVSYLTSQYVHKKRLLNAAGAASSQSIIRNSLRDITDPQVPGILSYLGVDQVIVHAEDKTAISSIAGLKEIDWNKTSNDPDSIYFDGRLSVFNVTAIPDNDGLSLATGSGFRQLHTNSTYTSADSLFESKAQLVVIDLAAGGVTTKERTKSAVFSANTTGDRSRLQVTQKGAILWEGLLSDSASQVNVIINTKYPIILKRVGGGHGYDININNLNLL